MLGNLAGSLIVPVPLTNADIFVCQLNIKIQDKNRNAHFSLKYNLWNWTIGLVIIHHVGISV